MSRSPLRAVVLVFVLAACGGGSGDAPDGSSDVDAPAVDAASSAAGYCAATVDAFCGFYLRCGRMVADDLADCRAAFLEGCARYTARYEDLEQAGLLALSSDGVLGCTAHLGTVACEDQPLDLSGPCARMWVGAQPAGAPCGLDVESFVCGPGTACQLDLSFCGTCATVAGPGGGCENDLGCAGDAHCDDDGSCQPRAAAGDPCASVPCAPGLRCGGDDLCFAPIYALEDGACGDGVRCPYRSSCIAGTCHRDALLDEPCGADTACTAGRCVDGACAPLLGDDAPCTDGAECATGRCGATDRCEPLPGACF